jgi:hypothetical protein
MKVKDKEPLVLEKDQIYLDLLTVVPEFKGGWFIIAKDSSSDKLYNKRIFICRTERKFHKRHKSLKENGWDLIAFGKTTNGIFID